MRKPNRIGMSLFDEELKSLINASAKIFPITQEMIDNNLNPDNYEYGKIDRAIYKWLNNHWDYIIADDVDIKWSDIEEKPTTFPPTNHTHTELHTHNNKSTLDKITEILINSWNTVTGKADKTYVDDMLDTKSDTTHGHDDTYSKLSHEHNYSPSEHDHDGVYSKLLHEHDYSPIGHNHDLKYSTLIHNHDGVYYKKTEIDTKVNAKSNIDHTHIIYEDDIEDLDTRVYMIENGYTEGHSHDNLDTLGKFEEVSGKPYYNGAEIGGAVPNLTLNELILGGRYKIAYNDVEDSLDIEVI